jgi:hypothetical protein
VSKKNADVRVYVVESKSVSPVLLQADQERQFTIDEASEKELLTLPKMWSTQKTKCLIEDD